jgi:peroxiredoxin
MIEQGQTLPNVVLTELTADGMQNHQVTELFADKKVVLFAVPGAFTPTCSAAHLPGYVVLADQIKVKGVNIIACVSVNDAFVMKAWGEAHNASELMMLGDGDAAVTKAIGLDKETGSFGGVRSQRYAMIIENGVVTELAVEAADEFEVSKAESILEKL